jgi:hypothetical protein
MVFFENRRAAYFQYVSTGSAEKRHLQTGIT